MKGLVDGFVKFAGTLPGFGIAFLIATMVYGYLKSDPRELSTKETSVTAVFCWLLYHAASLLDDLYDKIYRPDSRLRVWRSGDLMDARNKAARALFGPVDPRVTDYVSATRWHHITRMNSLNRQCAKVAAPTEAWRKWIGPTNNVSKAARTVFALAVVGIIVPHIGFVRDWPLVASSIAKLRPVNVGLLLGLTAIAAFCVYAVLRVKHNIDLYEHVAEHVTHLPRNTKQAAAVIHDVIVTDRRP